MDEIRKRFVIKTKQQLQMERTAFIEERDQKQMAATLRKEKMQALDKTRSNNMPLSDISLQNKQRADGLLSKAQMMLDE